MNDTSSLRAALSPRDWKERLRIPAVDRRLPQDAEWCEIREGGGWERLRFHDYGEIYRRPGLYEFLFYDLLRCESPQRVIGLLREVRADLAVREPLRAIDLGAGNGLVGRELRRAGAEGVVGIDILPEARAAALRDGPGLYDDYLVADMTEPSAAAHERLRRLRPNALACVAALGFGDIPPRAYYRAASYVEIGGLLAFNIKEEFLDPRYTYGFSELMRRMVHERVVRLEATRRYRHRFSAAGEPLYYTAMVATKLAEIPESMLVEN